MQVWRSSTWRRTSRTRPALIATLIAVPLAAGIVVGIKVVDHPGQAGLNLAAHGAGFRHHHDHGTAGEVTGPDGAVMNLNQTADEAADSTNCTLQVPANPLSARGLATPYVLGNGCEMSNPDLQAFVEADIFNPRTGNIKVYNPLVITEGTTPAANPVPPRIPRGGVVGIMFGFNGGNLLLTGTGNSLQQGNCVNGLGQSLFSQVAYCNSPAFYRAANRAIARGVLKIPALATGNDGQPCPTVRDFAVVDQDQSDNVVTTYLLTADGRTAQDSAQNAAALNGATPVNNGSDNALVNKFMDPALGCTPYQFPDKTAQSGMSGSQITDELLAAADQQPPIALIPLNDPMTLLDNQQSEAKTNAFRVGVDHPLLGTAGDQNASTPVNYCKHMMRVGMRRIQQDQQQLTNFATPVADTGNNLFTFMAARLSGSFDNMGCGALLNAPNPVQLTTDANGVATGATFSKLAIGALPGGVQPSATPTDTATATPTDTATAAPTDTPTDTPTGTATTPAPADPTATPTDTPTTPADPDATATPTPPTQGMGNG
jgi:hypothetical protein